MKLAEESQHLPTFICSEERYKYLRTPMGLVSTGNEYSRLGDIAIEEMTDVENLASSSEENFLTNLLDTQAL